MTGAEPSVLRLTEGGDPVELPLPDAVGEALAISGAVDAVRTGGGYWSIAPRGKVGALRVGPLELWLRPKVPIERVLFLLGYANNRGWRADHLPFDPAPDLLPALADAYVRQAERALAGGLLQGYRTIDDEQTVLRGRLRTTDQLTARHGIAIPLLVRYDEHTVDIAENRLLRAATEVLLRLPGVGRGTRRRLRHLRFVLGDITPLPAGAAPPTWRATRLNARYHEALWLAELLLARNSLHQRRGRVPLTGFLIDMAKVYEDFLGATLTAALHRHGGRVRLQDRHHLDERRRIIMRPDIVWYRDGHPAAVIDAKYKAEQPSGFPDADLYQLLAYATALNLPDGHLVYARGNAPEAVHTVRHAGIHLHAHTLDLAAPPASLLAQVDALTARIAAVAGDAEQSGASEVAP